MTSTRYFTIHFTDGTDEEALISTANEGATYGYKDGLLVIDTGPLSTGELLFPLVNIKSVHTWVEKS